MPHLVTSAQAEDHVNSYNDRHYNAGTYGPGQYVLASGNNLAATMVDSNTLRILDGAGLVNGAFWEIEGAFEELVIENGTPGYNRIDLVVAHIETAPQETIELRVLKGEETTGEPVMPAHIEGDLNNGDTVVEQPLHAVTLDGINPGEPVAQFEVTPSFAEFRDSLSQRVEHVQLNMTVAPGAWQYVGLPHLDGLTPVFAWLADAQMVDNGYVISAPMLAADSGKPYLRIAGTSATHSTTIRATLCALYVSSDTLL